MIICESWLDNSINSSVLSVPNYNILRKGRNKNGGGILLYYKTCYSIDSCSCLNVDLQDCKTDILWFLLQPGNIIVICIYHPYWGNSPHHSKVIDVILEIVTHANQVHRASSILLCGDFNGLAGQVNLINSLLNTTCLFEHQTRGSAQLDFVLSNSAREYSKPKFLPPLGRSDHIVVFCPTEKSPRPPEIQKIRFRTKCPLSCANFRFDMEHTEILRSVLFESDVNKATSILMECLSFFLEKHFPLRTVKMRSDDKPWIKPSLKYLINKRDKAFAERKILKYARLREAVIRLTLKLKHDYLQFGSDVKNSRKHWCTINKLLNRSKQAACTSSLDAETARNLFFRF